MGQYRDPARARHSTPARDCARVRTCDRTTQFRRHLSDARLIVSATNDTTGLIPDISGFRSRGRSGSHPTVATKYTPAPQQLLDVGAKGLPALTKGVSETSVAMFSPARGDSGPGAPAAVSSSRFRNRRSCRSRRWQAHRRWSRTRRSQLRRRPPSTAKSRWLCGRTVRRCSSALASRVCSFEHITRPAIVAHLSPKAPLGRRERDDAHCDRCRCEEHPPLFFHRVRRLELGFRRRRTDRHSGPCSPTAVSAGESCQVSGVRTRARRCRRRPFASDCMRNGRARDIQPPRVTAQLFARATDRPNPGGSSQTQTSRLVSCFGHLRFPTGQGINGERTFGHAAFRLRATSWTSSPGGRTAGRGRGRARASSRSSAAMAATTSNSRVRNNRACAVA